MKNCRHRCIACIVSKGFSDEKSRFSLTAVRFPSHAENTATYYPWLIGHLFIPFRKGRSYREFIHFWIISYKLGRSQIQKKRVQLWKIPRVLARVISSNHSKKQSLVFNPPTRKDHTATNQKNPARSLLFVKRRENYAKFIPTNDEPLLFRDLLLLSKLRLE